MRLSQFNKLVLASYCLIYGVMASGGGHEKYSPASSEFWYCSLFCIVLVCFSGFCSGATQGLLSIDQLNLELKRKQGSKQEKEMAEIILPVLEQHHLLLSTLLISNASANESLPIFLHQLVPDWAAVLISSVFVVLLGEVVPSAFTTGPDQLTIAIKLIPFVKVLQSVLYIVCYPLSLFLDWILGIHNKTRLKRYPIRDLRALLQLHAQVDHGEHPVGTGNNFMLESHPTKNPLSNEEIHLINSLMDLRVDVVTKQSIEIAKVFMVSSEEKFSREFATKLKIKGFSRVPVFVGENKQQILGTFNTKCILRYSEQDYGKPIRNLVQLSEPLIVGKDTSMLQMLMIFQEKRRTLAFISDHQMEKGGEDVQDVAHSPLNQINKLVLNPRGQDIGRIIAIICLNDVFEEMLDVELKDDDIHGTLRPEPIHARERGKSLLGPIREGKDRLKNLVKPEGVEKGLEEMLLQKK